MKSLFIIILALVINTTFSYTGNREKININEDWFFIKGELKTGFAKNLALLEWEKVNLPHTWNVWDSFDTRVEEDSLFDIAEYYYRGPGWYRKEIFFPKSDKGKRIFIEFEAANVLADVWVNEIHVGQHIGGYSGFKYDITDYLYYGKNNLIAVRVDNSFNYDIPPQRADYTMYGGIYRDVYLVKTNQTYFEYVHITTPKVSEKEAEIFIEPFIINKSENDFNGSLKFEVFDPVKKKISEQSFEISIKGKDSVKLKFDLANVVDPKLWSPDSPNLYNFAASIEINSSSVDRITNHFGIRWYEFDGQEGFFLNGSYLKLHGVNRHQDRYGYGNALPNELHREDVRIIKDIGANFLRLAHYQQDPVVLNMCDSLGLLVWEEIPVITSVGEDKFKENAKSMLYEMITQHYNHPSIIVWGLMNETVRSQPNDRLHINVEICKELSEMAKELDTYRYTTQAQMRARGEDIHKYTDIRAWNKYFGWYYDDFEDFGPFMDNEHAKDPNQPFIISEYGAGSKLGYHVENPTEPDFSEEWALEFHRSHWEQIKARKWIAGSTVWNMYDFASDEKAGNEPHINQKGLASFDRKPKDVFYYYQSEWSKEPMIYIVSHTWLEREGKKNELKKLEVLSNCYEVELVLNEKSFGTKTNKPFIWEINYQPGKNIIKAMGIMKDVKVYDELEINYKVID